MTHPTMLEERTSRGIPRPMLLLAGLAVATVTGTSAYTLWHFQTASTTTTPVATIAAPRITTVTALGRLEPGGEVVQLAAPTTAEGSRVEQLLVKEGDRLQAGQIVAILDSRDRLQAALYQAQEQARVAEANLAQVQAGAKTGEIEAQRAAIARLEAERTGDLEAQAAAVARLEATVQNAAIEDQRYQTLAEAGAISASERDSKRLTLETAQRQLQEAQATLARTRAARQQQIQEARATLERIAEVRPVDIAAAEAEVRAAKAAVQQAEANLEQAYVRSPQNGQVLEILTRPGELVSNEGIVEIGQTGQMYAIAEVYESDVQQIRPGQSARISSQALTDELQGTVEQVGFKVRKQNVVNTDPAANIDARVVEVKVKLDPASSRKAAGFTNLQVKVVMTR